MPNWRFWERPNEPPAPEDAPPRRTAPAGETIIPTKAPPRPPAADPQQLATLKRRREGMLFDVEQSELAHEPENPWRERIALLHETIRNVQRDIHLLDATPRIDRPPFPPTAVSIDEVRWEDPARIAFTIGTESIVFESELDWAERGTYVSRNELNQTGGTVDALIPTAFTPDERAFADAALKESLFIFASDLRRRAEEDESIPTSVTLADLIAPCPACGDWQLWGGFCPTCTARAQQRKALADEIGRLTEEANQEEETRAKLADRLPIARRRLADVESEIARIEQSR